MMMGLPVEGTRRSLTIADGMSPKPFLLLKASMAIFMRGRPVWIRDNLTVQAAPLDRRSHAFLIGRDLLDHWKFVYHGRKKRFSVSF